MKTKPERMFELLRDVVRKGRDRNQNKILQLKAKVIRSPVAKTVMELEQVLADWKCQTTLVTEADQTTLDEEHQTTILMTIISGEFVEHMRKVFHKSEYLHNCHAFEQQLFAHIAKKRMGEEARKGNKGFGQVTEQEGDTAQGYEPCPDEQLAKEGYDEMQL